MNELHDINPSSPARHDNVIIGSRAPQAGNFSSLTVNAIPVATTNAAVTALIGPNGVIPISSATVQKIKAAIASAERLNSVDAAPWSMAVTWAVNTTYYGNQIVRGTGSDSGNMYYCFGTASGYGATTSGLSSATGTGPTGTGTAPILDNQIYWFYAGKGSATGTYPLYSTVTPAASTDVMNGYCSAISTTVATTIGLVQSQTYSVPYAAGLLFHVTGGAAVNASGSQTSGNVGTVATPNTSPSNVKNVVTTITNSRKWIGFQMSTQFYASIQPFAVEINGRMLTETQVQNSTGSNSGMLLLNMEPFGEGTKTIRIFFQGDTVQKFAYAIWLEPESFAYKNENSNRYRIAFEGDSITAGGFFGQIANAGDYVGKVARLIGCDEYFSNAVGGTGFIANNSNNGTTYRQRLSYITGFSPDIIIVNGAHNDNFSSSPLRRTQFLAYLVALRAANPIAIIGVLGALLLQGESLAAGSGSNEYDVEVDLNYAFTQWADTNSFFIPMLTDPAGPQLTSVNGRWYANLGSNQFTDGHPIPFFYTYLSRKVANAIKAYLRTK